MIYFYFLIVHVLLATVAEKGTPTVDNGWLLIIDMKNLSSMCNSIIAGICSGTIGATLLLDGFEYEHYWDMGYY